MGAYVGSDRRGDPSGSAERGARERLTSAHPLAYVLPHACAVGRANVNTIFSQQIKSENVGVDMAGA